MSKYILIDTSNTFFKSRHFASRMSSDWEKIGMALHITLSGIQSVVRKFGSDDVHVVFALEGRSWRKDYYEPYKANRAVKRQALTEAEVTQDQMFWDTYSAMTEYLSTKTNCSVLRCPVAEADDIIARFIDLHPDDEHFIISSDSDFHQLLKENVKQYNSIQNELITIDGYFNDKERPIMDKKTNLQKTIGDPQYVLFEKCMRGDTSDNVFSAYPGVRTKSTKKTVGLLDAYADRERRGFNWNNLMLQRWVDHNGGEHRVMDDYERNRKLIDLTLQPQEIKDQVDQCIREGVRCDTVANVGLHFMKFCGKYELTKIGEHAEYYAKWLNNSYHGVLKK
jgi:5'-3' exonuclease